MTHSSRSLALFQSSTFLSYRAKLLLYYKVLYGCSTSLANTYYIRLIALLYNVNAYAILFFAQGRAQHILSIQFQWRDIVYDFMQMMP